MEQNWKKCDKQKETQITFEYEYEFYKLHYFYSIMFASGKILREIPFDIDISFF